MMKTSRKLHRLTGIIFLVWFAAMGLSGIVLNHPDLIDGIDLARDIIPGDYEYTRWDRASFRGGLKVGEGELIFGEAGVWRVVHEAQSSTAQPPENFNQGLSDSAYLRDVRAVVMDDAAGTLYAGTRGGLYKREVTERGGQWSPVEVDGGHEPVVDLVRTPGSLVVLTRSHVYRVMDEAPGEFTQITPPRKIGPEETESLFRLIFEMHSGHTWGLAGRLLVDFIGLATLFFTITGGWFWWKRKKKKLATGAGGKLARKGLKLHIKAGLWLAPLLFFVALTGILQRPPFLIAIASVEYPNSYYPGVRDPNPWYDKLRKALYDPSSGTLLISTADGVFEGGLSGDREFDPIEFTPPISVMGATAFQMVEGARMPTILVGSMSGMYLWDRKTGLFVDFFTGQPSTSQYGPPVGDNMITGAWKRGGRWLWGEYDKGMGTVPARPLWRGPKRVQRNHMPMPAELSDGGRISLWHALFELHNGRMFAFILGWWSWVAVPVGGLLFMTGTVSGIMLRLGRGKNKKSRCTQ